MALSGVRQEYLYICVQGMHEEGYAITEICDILNLNRSSYYKWIHRFKSSSELENEALLHDIGLIYAEHNGTYGYRRIADEYNATHEKQYNLKRFYRLVHTVGLLAVIRRKRPAYQRSKPEVTAENILNREFTANTVNEKWCTDVTEMKYGSEGEKAYLSAILDLKGRDIVSFAIGRHNNNQLVFETFDLAIQKYPDAHPLFHSDRGFQYTSKQFKDMLEKQGHPTRVLSAITMAQVCEPYIRRRALRHMDKGRVVICAAGTGNPYFTTDTTAALRGMELQCDAIIKATKVDGIYDKDPAKFADATKFDTITYDETLNRHIGVMDATAFALVRDNNLPIIVCRMLGGDIIRAVKGEKIGTIVTK